MRCNKGEKVNFTKQVMACVRIKNEQSNKITHFTEAYFRNIITHRYISLYPKQFVCFDNLGTNKNSRKHSAWGVVSIENPKARKSILLK